MVLYARLGIDIYIRKKKKKHKQLIVVQSLVQAHEINETKNCVFMNRLVYTIHRSKCNSLYLCNRFQFRQVFD